MSTTQYMLSVHHGDTLEFPEGVTMDQVFADVGAFNDDLQTAGALVFAGGLMPASTARVVDATGDGVSVTDGPYLMGAEYLGGFWIITAPTPDDAVEWARKGSAACRGTVEVRPFQGA